MQKCVIVIYDTYELRTDGSVSKFPKWERVPFCEENIEYNESDSYEENVKSFVSECISSQAVYIGNKYIPLHNIHGWYFDKDDYQKADKKCEQTNTNQLSRHGKKHGKWKEIKHKNREQNKPASASLPFQVENITATIPPIPPIPPPPSPRLIRESDDMPFGDVEHY